MSTTREKLLKAIEQLGATDVERAKRLGKTVRTVDYWQSGKGLKTVESLVDAGVLHIVENPTAEPKAA